MGYEKIIQLLFSVLGSLAIGFIAFFLAWWRWKNRIDEEAFIVSLNTPIRSPSGEEKPKSLRMYTLLQCRLKDAIENAYARNVFLKAAKKTTQENPFIDLGQYKLDIMNPILNEISQITASGFIARDLGLPSTEGEYVLALTRERYPGMRWISNRVMVVKKSWLTSPNNFDGDPAEWDLQYPHHKWRVETLRLMQQDCRNGIENSTYCMSMILSIPR